MDDQQVGLSYLSVGSEPELLWLEISLDKDPSNILLVI